MAKKQTSGKGKGAKGSGKGSSKAAPKRERKPGELSRFQKGVIILFVAVFALSTLAGALASVVQSQQSTTITYDVDYVDSLYEQSVQDLEAQVEADPSNAEALLSLAQSCSSWGSMVSMLAADDEETAHGTELLERAIGYYDKYLQIEDSADARCDRALCYSYLGDVDTAVSELEAVTESYPDHAAAWADLGMLYESQGSTDAAVAAYERAIELDPDDEAGAKSYAEGRLESLQGSDSEGAAADGATGDESADGADSAEDASGADATDTTDSSATE